LRLTLQGHDAFAGLPARSTLRRWIVRALQVDAELTLRFVGTREGRRLNRDFRRRDHATNVLTFNYAASPMQADIVLCLPVVAREARLQGKTLRAHLAHLVIHGTLHAQGHEHENAAEAARMERLETLLLAELGYPDPYQLAPQHSLRRPLIRARS
jgi:probable rRNA maturation factor